MNRVMLIILMLGLLAGCAGAGPGSSESSPASAPAAPAATPDAAAASSPTPAQAVDAPAAAASGTPANIVQDGSTLPHPPDNRPAYPDYLSTPLTPYENADLGIRLSYPANFDAPTRASGSFRGVTFAFATGQITIDQQPMPPALTLEDQVAAHMADTARLTPRVVPDAHGVGPLAGHPAGYVRYHFDSAAGRHDFTLWWVPVGSQEYVISCGTKEGPPPIPWEVVRPVCDRVFDTLELAPGQN